MKLKNVTTEMSHSGEVVTLTLEIPALDFIHFVESLKKERASLPTVIKIKAEGRSLKEQKDDLFAMIAKYREANPRKYPKGLYDQFFTYWSETNGKKIRKEDPKYKYWEVGKRLSTFKKFMDIDTLNKLWQEHEAEARKISNTLFSDQPQTTSNGNL